MKIFKFKQCITSLLEGDTGSIGGSISAVVFFFLASGDKKLVAITSATAIYGKASLKIKSNGSGIDSNSGIIVILGF